MKDKLIQGLRNKEPDADAKIREALVAKKITPEESGEIRKAARMDPLVQMAKKLSLEELTKRIENATDEQKAILRPVLQEKFTNKAPELKPEERVRYMRLIREMAKKKIVSNAAIPARADGGRVKKGKPYLVGERGPEVIVPKQDGEVIPNEKLRVEERLRDYRERKRSNPSTRM